MDYMEAEAVIPDIVDGTPVYRCPECRSTDLRIKVEVWATITDNRFLLSRPLINLTVDAADVDDATWDEEEGGTVIQCLKCDHMDDSYEFEVHPDA